MKRRRYTLAVAGGALADVHLFDGRDALAAAALGAVALSAAEDADVAAITHEGRRVEVAMRRGALRLVAGERLGVAPADAPVTRGSRGEPLIDFPYLHVSASTREGHIAVALGEAPLGVDVEKAIARENEPHAMLHPAEIAALDRATAKERPLLAAVIWAAKEAHWKARRLPLGRDPATFSASLDGEDLVVDDPVAGDTRGQGLWIDDAGVALAVVGVDEPEPSAG